MAFGVCIFIASVGLVCWYVGAFRASHFYTRYFSPLSLPCVVLLGSLALHVAAKRLGAITAMGGLAALGFLAIVAMLSTGRIGAENTMYTGQLALVRSVVPDGTLVAAGQSGTLGYFRDNVVNLDGKVNPGVLPYEGRKHDYLDERDIGWLCDWPEHIEAYLGPDPSARGWMAMAEHKGFHLYRRGIAQ